MTESSLSLDSFPSPEELYQRYLKWKGESATLRTAIETLFIQMIQKSPRYFQERIATISFC